MKVDFKFEIGQKVITDLGERGIIDTVAVNSNKNNIYYVRCIVCSNWLNENQIQKIDE